MCLLMRASTSNAPKLVANDVDQLVGLNRMVLLLVGMVTHVLAIDGHRRSRRFGRRRLPLVVGATGKGDKRKRG